MTVEYFHGGKLYFLLKKNIINNLLDFYDKGLIFLILNCYKESDTIS